MRGMWALILVLLLSGCSSTQFYAILDEENDWRRMVDQDMNTMAVQQGEGPWHQLRNMEHVPIVDGKFMYYKGEEVSRDVPYEPPKVQIVTYEEQVIVTEDGEPLFY